MMKPLMIVALAGFVFTAFGCASSGLEELTLVSAKEISMQKRQAEEAAAAEGDVPPGAVQGEVPGGML